MLQERLLYDRAKVTCKTRQTNIKYNMTKIEMTHKTNKTHSQH
jgi:hypothetical protein